MSKVPQVTQASGKRMLSPKSLACNTQHAKEIQSSAMSTCFTPHERYQDVFSSSEDEREDAQSSVSSDHDEISSDSLEINSQDNWVIWDAAEGSPGLFAAAQMFVESFGSGLVEYIHVEFVQQELGITLTEAHGLLAVLEVLEVWP
jgi:hypothetical protein